VERVERLERLEQVERPERWNDGTMERPDHSGLKFIATPLMQ
jgi:hypothetical protein